jgi:hypothetical protein
VLSFPFYLVSMTVTILDSPFSALVRDAFGFALVGYLLKRPLRFWFSNLVASSSGDWALSIELFWRWISACLGLLSYWTSPAS